MLKEFRTFLMRGNVIELAVGIVMGAAFTAIVSALVDNIITPIIAAVTGNASVDALSVQIGAAQIEYGLFLQAIIDFVLIALVLFLMIRFINSLSRKREMEEEVEVEAPTAEHYLEEIRDLLAERQADSRHYPDL